MKVLFVISSWGHGRGGHFYSLKTIRDAMAIDSVVLNVGATPSPVFGGGRNVLFLGIQSGYFSSVRKACEYIRKEGVTHLHSFDVDAYLFASYLSNLCGLPLVNTKPGGPSPRFFYPLAKYQTVFSSEDYECFKNRRLGKSKKLELISNRVSGFECDDVLVGRVRREVGGRLVLLRIARIGNAYKRSICQTIALAAALQKRGIQIVPVIVGVIQDRDVYESVLPEIEAAGGLVLSDEQYTLNAKKMLRCGDFVVGTGRSLMEASFTESILLAPTGDGEFPLLIGEGNYEEFKYSNFSGRGIVNSDHTIVEDMATIIEDEVERKRRLMFVENIRNRDFDVRGGVAQYLRFYSTALESVGWMFLIINVTAISLRRLLKRFL